MKFDLRFPEHHIKDWAESYAYGQGDVVPLELAPTARKRGWLTQAEFRSLTKWKSPRTQKRCAQNVPEFIRNVTTMALSTRDERLKIEVLTLLDGVAFPTASVILHFCARQKYPIIDFRALWSLSLDVPKAGYDFDLWWQYCLFTRKMAARVGVTMRVLDRALWQYSKERQ